MKAKLLLIIVFLLLALPISFAFNISDFKYNGYNVVFTGQSTVPVGYAENQTHFWMAMAGDNAVYEYLKSTGAYTGFTFASGFAQLRGICIAPNGTFYVIGRSDATVKEFTHAGVATGFSFATVATPGDVDCNATTSGVGIDKFQVFAPSTVTVYTSGGVATGTTCDMSSKIGAGTGIKYSNSSYYGVGTSQTGVYQFNSACQYVSEFAQTEEGTLQFSHFNGSWMRIGGNDANKVFGYNGSQIYPAAVDNAPTISANSTNASLAKRFKPVKFSFNYSLEGIKLRLYFPKLFGVNFI